MRLNWNGKHLWDLFQETGLPPDVSIPIIHEEAEKRGRKAVVTVEGYDEAKKAHGDLSRAKNTKLGISNLHKRMIDSQ